MYGKVRADMREILRTLCNYKKVEKLLNLAFENPKLLRYRNKSTVNKDFLCK